MTKTKAKAVVYRGVSMAQEDAALFTLAAHVTGRFVHQLVKDEFRGRLKEILRAANVDPDKVPTTRKAKG